MEPIKILVVDDEPLVERLINQRFRKKIKSKHYEFHFAENGVEGLSKLDQHQDVDIILSDINMPKMDGLTFLSKLGELERELKVVLVSAYGDMKNIRSGMNLGAYDFVTKPIDFQDLEITIEKALREVQVLKEAQQVRLKLTHLEQELSVATKIQQSIIPSDYEEVLTSKKIDLFAKMIPAKEVGGDFYDFFKVDEDHVACIVADVSGKGIPAALFMAI
ncbi:MAG: response regulator, partial [Bacteroidota bacterium]